MVIDSRREDVREALVQLSQHCTASQGGSFLSGPVRARLFSDAVNSFSIERFAAPTSKGDSKLDALLKRVAHRMIRRQFSLDSRWYNQTKEALASALELASDEESELKVESALVEVFTIVGLAACVFTSWVALEGFATAEKLTLAGSNTQELVSNEQWGKVRGLSPSAMAAPGTPLLGPFGSGDNAERGGNRMHAVLRAVPGDVLPSSVQLFLQSVGSMGGLKGAPMRCCTLAPGDMAAFLFAMSTLYTPPELFTSFSKLPGRQLTRAEMECVANGTASTLACSF